MVRQIVNMYICVVQSSETDPVLNLPSLSRQILPAGDRDSTRSSSLFAVRRVENEFPGLLDYRKSRAGLDLYKHRDFV